MKKLIVLCLLICTACDENSAKNWRRNQAEYMTGQAERGEFPYFQDPLTDLCFVRFDRSISNVPCTDKVMKRIKE